MTTSTPWTLASPWYRANSVTGARVRPGRGTPVIQKYAASDPVTPFLEEPQRSLRFTGDDLVQHLFAKRHVLLDAGNRGDGKGEPLKLFQPLHARFYLVVCELYCQVPGWPPVTRDQVCEAGFVVRRKVPDVPDDDRVELNRLFAEKLRLLTRAEYLAPRALREKTDPREDIEHRLRAFWRGAGSQAAQKKLADLKKDVDKIQSNIKKLAGAGAIRNRLQGWVAGEHPNVGTWSPDIEPEPQDLGDELAFPLFALTPDPAARGHSAVGSSLYYGLIPTHSGDIDGGGAPRFDDRSLYHIRCFVRRHQSRCARTATPGDCRGELVWSQATESYRLASPYDLDGTSNRPVNIRLPNLDALQAHAKRAGPGGSAGARFDVPPGSALPIKTNGMDLPEKVISTGGGRGDQVCFFAIPLITLVALFVLSIFLPILLFLFQLWFLLRLKLCIPPGIDIDADLAVELEIKGPEIEAKLELDASFQLEIGGAIFSGGGGQASVDAVKTALKNQIAPGGDLDPTHLDNNSIQGLKDEIDADLDNAVDLIRTMGADLSSVAVAGDEGTLANGSRGLVYFGPEARA